MRKRPIRFGSMIHGIRDVIVIPIHKLSNDINEIRFYVAQYIVAD